MHARGIYNRFALVDGAYGSYTLSSELDDAARARLRVFRAFRLFLSGGVTI